MAESTAFKEILRLVAADRAVVSRVGNPITADPDSISGNLQLDGDDGMANLRFQLGGPRGRVQVQVDAKLRDGVWTVDTINLAAPRA